MVNILPKPQWVGESTRKPLQWRHNECDSVSNHQSHDYLLNRLFGCRSKKTSKLRFTGLCAGNSPGTGEFPAQMASNAENVSIWWRHHERKWFKAAVDLVIFRTIMLLTIIESCCITRLCHTLLPLLTAQNYRTKWPIFPWPEVDPADLSYVSIGWGNFSPLIMFLRPWRYCLCIHILYLYMNMIRWNDCKSVTDNDCQMCLKQINLIQTKWNRRRFVHKHSWN